MELVHFPNGTTSLKDSRLGEAMHSSIGPWQEAHKIYIEQSGLSVASQLETEQPLVLYDVGLGIAANALAAIEAHEMLASRRPLRIISFENELSGLTTALECRAHFPFIEQHQEKVRALLKAGFWSGKKTQWELRHGDFETQTLGNPSPEIIFYDFYSPKSTSSLWSVRQFSRLREACEDRRTQGIQSTLVTYSAATWARSSLILSGFYVGYGRSTDAKLETTIASTFLDHLKSPLDERWLLKLSRSSQPLPKDYPNTDRKDALEKINAFVLSKRPQ